MIDGQEEADALRFGLVERGFGDVDLVGFDEGLAGVLTLGVEEGVGHAAADEDGVDLVEQVVDDFDLVGDLGAADDGDEGTLGGFESLADVGEFLLHEQAGSGLRDEVGDAFGGGVGAVGADRRHRSRRRRRAWRVAWRRWGRSALLRRGSEGFRAAGPGRTRSWRDISEAISPTQSGEKATLIGFADLFIEEHAQSVDDGAKARTWDGLALGAAEMRGEDELGLVAEGVLDGGEGRADAVVVGDFRTVVAEGHVEVNAHEDPLVLEIEVLDRELGHDD